MENNWELEQINQSLQGYQLNVLSLSAELQRTKQKEQLEAKEKTLKEYRELVEQLKTQNEQQKPLIETTQESKENLPTKIQNPLKTSKEVLIEESRSEQWERRINSLEGRLRLLETENSELENERKRLVEILNKQRERIKNRKNIQTQELSEEYNSLRERSRISVRPLRPVDSSTIETTLKKENNRILKENSLLNKSNETLKTEAEQLKERLRRAEIHSKAGTELWETRKKHEQAMANIRKRLTEAEARERELHERLERRERHIEQMGRVQSDKLADNDKLNIALRQWRIEREELTKKTIRTEEEKQAINTRYSEAINRLDLLAMAELYQRETAEQLNSLKQKHSQLLEDYNNLFKIGKEFNKKSSLKEDNEIVGIVLLKDKLAARERELELFRRKIIELERKIWHFEMERN
uniref:Uncharacterized protein n=1 Tax=Meloidogyne javanica TaxID=6303 RepID=A0A915N8J2_MELJA